MPVIRRPRAEEPARHAELRHEIVEELQRDEPIGPEHAPQIVEEETRHNTLNITVVWDAWQDVTPEQRGKIIMDAYEEARPDDMVRITIALGLTHAYAERLGISVPN